MVTPSFTRLISALPLVVAALGFPARGLAQLAPGDVFPAFEAADLGGAPIPPPQGHVALIDFWASWCAPCKASFPAYSRIQLEFAAQGVVVIAVSVDQSAASYRAFVDKLKPAFATTIDLRHALVGKVQVPTMPTSYILDAGGRIRFVHAGFHGAATEAEIRREIRELLDGVPSPR